MQIYSGAMQTTSVIFPEPNRVEAQQVDVGELRPDQVRLRTHRSLISTGTELKCLQQDFSPGGAWEQWVQYPFLAGYCAAGEVIEAGSAIQGVEVGDRVAGFGEHRRHPAVAADYMAKIPDGISYEEAAWFPLAAIVQFGFRHARLELGETVAVVGLGLLGQLCVRYARRAGAADVIAIDRSARRLEMAREGGATNCLETGVEEAVEPVRDITGGKMANVLYEAAGAADVFAPCQRLLGNFGRLVSLGDTGHAECQSMTEGFSTRNLTLIGANNDIAPLTNWPHPRSGEVFMKFLQRGDLAVADLITHRFPVERAPEAYRMLLEDRTRAMGVVFTYD